MVRSKTEGWCSVAWNTKEGLTLTVSQERHPQNMSWGNSGRTRCDVFRGWRGPGFWGRWATVCISSQSRVVGRKGEETQRIGNKQIFSLPETHPCTPWLFLCLCLSHPFHQDCSHPNNSSQQVVMSSSGPNVTPPFFPHCSWPSCKWDRTLPHGSSLSSYFGPHNLVRPLCAIYHLIFKTTEIHNSYFIL